MNQPYLATDLELRRYRLYSANKSSGKPIEDYEFSKEHLERQLKYYNSLINAFINADKKAP